MLHYLVHIVVIIITTNARLTENSNYNRFHTDIQAIYTCKKIDNKSKNIHLITFKSEYFIFLDKMLVNPS